MIYGFRSVRIEDGCYFIAGNGIAFLSIHREINPLKSGAMYLGFNGFIISQFDKVLSGNQVRKDRTKSGYQNSSYSVFFVALRHHQEIEYNKLIIQY